MGRSESLKTPSSATKEMNKVMGRIRRGSSFKGDDLENSGGGVVGGVGVSRNMIKQNLYCTTGNV